VAEPTPGGRPSRCPRSSGAVSRQRAARRDLGASGLADCRVSELRRAIPGWGTWAVGAGCGYWAVGGWGLGASA